MNLKRENNKLIFEYFNNSYIYGDVNEIFINGNEVLSIYAKLFTDSFSFTNSIKDFKDLLNPLIDELLDKSIIDISEKLKKRIMTYIYLACRNGDYKFLNDPEYCCIEQDESKEFFILNLNIAINRLIY